MTSSLRMYSIDWETKLKRKNFGGSVWNMHDSDLVEGWQSLKLPAKVTRWVAVSTSNLLGGCGGRRGEWIHFFPWEENPTWLACLVSSVLICAHSCSLHLVISCYTHRAKYHAALTKELFIFQVEINKKSFRRTMYKVRDLGTLSPTWIIFIKPLSGIHVKVGWKIVRLRDRGWL